MSSLSLNSTGNCNSPIPFTDTDTALQMEEVKTHPKKCFKKIYVSKCKYFKVESCSCDMGSCGSLNQSCHAERFYKPKPSPKAEFWPRSVLKPQTIHSSLLSLTRNRDKSGKKPHKSIIWPLIQVLF